MLKLQNNTKLQQIPESDYSHIVVAGDYNYPEIDLNTWTTANSEERNSQKFNYACRDAYLHRHTTKPTRHWHGQNESLLNLIFMNEEHMVQSPDYLSGLGMLFNVHVYTDNRGQAEPKFRYYKGNYASMNDHLENVDWSPMDNRSMQKSWNFFNTTYEKVMDQFIPKSVSTKHRQK